MADGDDVTPGSMPSVHNDEQAHRFELAVDGHRAELIYHREGDRLVLDHTEVPVPLEGRGLGGALVMAAIDFARREHLTVVPRCPYARRWLQRHPEQAATVTIDGP